MIFVLNKSDNNNNNSKRTATNQHKDNTRSNMDAVGDGKFSRVNKLLLFIGYPRSGSTLFGSLLDAHPHTVVANEFNLIGKWHNLTQRHNASRNDIFDALFANSVVEAVSKQRAKNNNFFFNYYVPRLWQGRHVSFLKGMKFDIPPDVL